MAKHVHAEVIKAWADGAEIEVFLELADENRWIPCDRPVWSAVGQYRVKPVPHKWQKEMDAFKAGKVVEWRYTHIEEDMWIKCVFPWWDHPFAIFRIRPEKVEQMWYFEKDSHNRRGSIRHLATNLKLTFEDGKLVGAEVL